MVIRAREDFHNTNNRKKNYESGDTTQKTQPKILSMLIIAKILSYLINELMRLKQGISERPRSGARAPRQGLTPLRIPVRIPQRSRPIKRRRSASVLQLLLEQNRRRQRSLVDQILLLPRRPNPRPPIAPGASVRRRRIRDSPGAPPLRRRSVAAGETHPHSSLTARNSDCCSRYWIIACK